MEQKYHLQKQLNVLNFYLNKAKKNFNENSDILSIVVMVIEVIKDLEILKILNQKSKMIYQLKI